MKFNEIPPQSWFFYDFKWTAEMDTLLLRRIIGNEKECLPGTAHKSPHVLLIAMGDLNAKFGSLLHLVNVKERVAFLEGRYSTFKNLTRMPKTHWDLHKNCITADDGVWEKIFKTNVFAQAYYHKGEPEYYKMCVVFGQNVVKTEPSRTLILISDSPHGKVRSAQNHNSVSSSEEEVTSPLQIGSRKLARMLFDDDAHSSYAPPNQKTGHYYVPWPAIASKLKYPARNAFPMKPKDESGQPNIVGESSCASSSPLK